MATTFFLADADATAAAGEAIGRWLAAREAGGAVFLSGPLGAGKTSLARGVLRALGVHGPVRSPSYTLLEPYDCAGRSLLHMDLYRLREPEELENLGLRDFPPERSWWLVEWPEHGAGLLPPPLLRLQLSARGTGRDLTVEARGLPESERRSLLRLLQQAVRSESDSSP